MDWHAVIREEFARRQRPVDDSVVEELAQHAAAAFEAARADGSSFDAAGRSVGALINGWCDGASGPARLYRAPLVESASASSSPFAGLGLDVRHGLRVIRRQPLFALASVLLIALGVAATTTIFSVISGVLLKPLPWSAPDRIVRVSESREGGTVQTDAELTNASYLAWKESGTTLEAIAGWGTNTAAIESADGADRVPVATMTASLLPLLGVHPMIGAGFSDAEETEPVVVLSYSFWRDRFGSDPNVLGKSVRFVSGVRRIVGVMPASFEFVEGDVQLLIPMHVAPAIIPGSNSHSVSLFSTIARLKPGATPEQAAEEAQRIVRTIPDLGPVIPAVFGSDGPAHVRVIPMADAIVGDVRWALWALLAAVALLWFAATGSVASMQLAHAAGRQREVAIRAAIGAGQARIARQLFVENLIIASIGGAIGLGVTMWMLRELPGLLPQDFPRASLVALDWRVLVAAFVLVAGASIVIGLLPARMAARLDVRTALVTDGESTASRFSPARSRSAIIVSQVAIATLLLVGAALLGKSFTTQWHIDRGFASADVLTARVRYPTSMTSAVARLQAGDEILSRVRDRPGVRAAGLSEDIPLGGAERRFASMIREPGKPDVVVSALLRMVSPGYLEAIGMRVSAGRTFNEQDSMQSEPVAIVNRTFAAKYMSNAPVGEIVPAGLDNDHQERKWRVAGVVDDAMRGSIADTVQPEIFILSRQLPTRTATASFIAIRTSGDPARLAPDLLAIVRSNNRLTTLDSVMTMDNRILKSLSKPRLYAVLFGGFGVFALFIAIVGLFGGLSYGVTQRTREISVRTALGATRGHIIRLVVSQGLALTAIGMVIGLACAFAAARLVAKLLYGVRAHDTGTYLAVAGLLFTLALVACAIPARRAASIDPLAGMKR